MIATGRCPTRRREAMTEGKKKKTPLLLVQLKTATANRQPGQLLRATREELDAAGLVNGKDYTPKGTYPASANAKSDLLAQAEASAPAGPSTTAVDDQDAADPAKAAKAKKS
jgi:hypothetical protein